MKNSIFRTYKFLPARFVWKLAAHILQFSLFPKLLNKVFLYYFKLASNLKLLAYSKLALSLRILSLWKFEANNLFSTELIFLSWSAKPRQGEVHVYFECRKKSFEFPHTGICNLAAAFPMLWRSAVLGSGKKI